MLDRRHHAAIAAPVGTVERRAAPIFVFAAILIALAVVAVTANFAPPPILSGLPSDREARVAAAMIRNRFHVDAGALRFQSAMLGTSERGHAPSRADARLLARAETLLGRAHGRSPADPRIAASRAALDLVRHDLIGAERGYRAALDLGSRYGEARLGLGVTLAMRAAADSGRDERRLLLRGIAQFAAVEPRDPAYEAALYDRTLLLHRVERQDEALRHARAYLARDSVSAWAGRLREELGMGPSTPRVEGEGRR